MAKKTKNKKPRSAAQKAATARMLAAKGAGSKSKRRKSPRRGGKKKARSPAQKAATARMLAARAGGKRSRGTRHSAPAGLAVVSAPESKPTRRRKKGFPGKGGLNNPGTASEILLNGVLVIAGGAAAIKLDTLITARLLGVPPSAYALVGAIGTAVVASKYKRRGIARGAAATAIGLATGMMVRRIAAPDATS